ncbi:MAG: iron-siderophore ABC transporter substrate-binding protein [Pseudonocardiales bacterium]
MPIALLNRPAPIDDDATRRQFLIGGASLAALLAGCGTSAPAPGAAPDRGGGFPVTIDHQFGSTTIPRPPERVVSVGLTDQDVLLALGIKPIAVTDWFGLEHPAATGPWALPQLGEARPTVLDSVDSGYPYEQIATLRPDLIVGVHWGPTEEADYTKLAQIAPTVVATPEFATVNMPWQQATTLIGRAVGQSTKAAELVAGVEERFAMARARFPQFKGATAVPAYHTGEQFGCYGPEEVRGRFLTSLGFVLPPGLAELVVPGETFVQVSNEQLALLDGDLVVWFAYNEDTQKLIENNPVYQSLKIAREGRGVFIGNGDQATIAAALGFSTVLSLPYALDGLLPKLAAALDGDPATS